MTGFLIISGKSKVVSSLSLEKVQDFCTATGMSCHFVKISPVENAKHLIIGLQLTHAGIDDTIKAYSDRYFFLCGSLFGSLGQENTDLFSNDQARQFLAAKVGSRKEFSPRFLDGDCSIGLVCARTGQIQVFNDCQGFRRIFYYQDQQVFIASTRLPLILRLVDRDWRLDRQGARIFLADREPRWPLSIVKDIKTLPPVHQLVVRNGGLQITSYWDPIDSSPMQDKKEVARQLRRALTLAIRRKANGRRTAVALSGGYDSACLAKLSASLDCDIRAMSVGYDVENYDTDYDTYNETEYASRIAKQLGIGFQNRLFRLEDVRKMMAILPRILDQPGHDPTTFFLLCNAARESGYEALITGMGGDACFTPKEYFNYQMKFLPYLRVASKIPLGKTFIGILTKAASGRGPFAICQAYIKGYPPRSVFELSERVQQIQRGEHLQGLLGETIIEDINEVASLRAKVLEHTIENSHCAHEWHYLFSLWANPGGYHADLAITQSGMSTIMPFVESITNTILFSHASQHSMDNREFEAEVFEGIPKELLLPSKSGLALPYERWCRELLVGDLDEILADESWAGLGLNMIQLSQYIDMLKDPDWNKSRLVTRRIASFLWQLVMLKNYVEANELRV